MSLSTLGVILQLGGVATAAVGFWLTWREFAAPGEGFFDPVTVRVRAGWRRLWVVIDRIYRRIFRKGRVVIVGAGEIVATGSMSARGRVQYGELDTGDIREALRTLDARTHELMTRVSDVRDAMDDGFEGIRGEVADLSTRVDAIATGLEDRTRRAAIGGIRLEALGLVLVAVGTLLQGLGAAS